MDLFGPIVLQIVLIALNAVFACAEIAVIQTNEAKLEKLAEEKNRGARRLLKLTKNPSKFLSTIQVAITLAALLGSAYAADSFAEPLVDWLLSLGVTVPYGVLESACIFVITLALSFFSIVFGELVPKRVAMKYAEKTALGLSGLLVFVSFIFAPFVWILTKSTNAILRLFRINPDEQDNAATEEDIRIMVENSSEQGTIDSRESEMIQNIFRFDDISVSEVCTHRREVTVLYREDSLDTWRETLIESRHGYYPICGEDADDIVGILNSKKFFRSSCETIEDVMREAVEKPWFVPENTKADVLFNNMKETRNYFAVVIDEYGGTSGVITLHDLLELLVGDLGDKEDEVVEEITPTGEGEWRILGAATLEKVNEALGIELDGEEYECDTFGGYILALLGTVPDDGETLSLETDNLSIRIERVEDHRIERTSVILKEVPEEEEEDEE